MMDLLNGLSTAMFLLLGPAVMVGGLLTLAGVGSQLAIGIGLALSVVIVLWNL